MPNGRRLDLGAAALWGLTPPGCRLPSWLSSLYCTCKQKMSELLLVDLLLLSCLKSCFLLF